MSPATNSRPFFESSEVDERPPQVASPDPAPIVTGAWLMDGKEALPIGPVLGLRRDENGYVLYLELDGSTEPAAGDVLHLELEGREALFLSADRTHRRAVASPALNGLEVHASKGYRLLDQVEASPLAASVTAP